MSVAVLEYSGIEEKRGEESIATDRDVCMCVYYTPYRAHDMPEKGYISDGCVVKMTMSLALKANIFNSTQPVLHKFRIMSTQPLSHIYNKVMLKRASTSMRCMQGAS